MNCLYYITSLLKQACNVSQREIFSLRPGITRIQAKAIPLLTRKQFLLHQCTIKRPYVPVPRLQDGLLDSSGIKQTVKADERAEWSRWMSATARLYYYWWSCTRWPPYCQWAGTTFINWQLHMQNSGLTYFSANKTACACFAIFGHSLTENVLFLSVELKELVV